MIALNYFLQIELPPIVNAIEMIRSKNKELSSRVEEYAPLMKSNASQLSMVLNGVIDANVNGGIANYQSVCRFWLFLLNFNQGKFLN